MERPANVSGYESFSVVHFSTLNEIQYSRLLLIVNASQYFSTQLQLQLETIFKM